MAFLNGNGNRQALIDVSASATEGSVSCTVGSLLQSFQEKGEKKVKYKFDKDLVFEIWMRWEIQTVSR